VIGSTYEVHNVKSKDFRLFPHGSSFTDDSVLSVAVAEKILRDEKSFLNNKKTYANWLKIYYRKYPSAGFGQMFKEWACAEDLYAQKSFGNGAAMRVTAIAYAYDDLKRVLEETAGHPIRCLQQSRLFWRLIPMRTPFAMRSP